jgi:hypothetical protein
MAVRKSVFPTWLALPLLCLGCGMMLYAFLYPNGDGGRSAWTVEKATERQEASIAMHDAVVQATSAPPPATEPRAALRAATERYEQLEAERLAAIEGAKRFSRLLRWTGVVLACVGGGIYFLQRP